MCSGEAVGRWPAVPDAAVPVCLAAAQLAGTWAVADAAGRPLGRAGWAVAVAAVALSALALVGRRIAPVPVLAAVALISDAGLALAAPRLAADTPAGGAPVPVALYSLAAWRGPRCAVTGLLAVTAAGAAARALSSGGPVDLLEEAASFLLNASAVALGAARQRRRAARRALAGRLADAARERRAAAAAERERLARDLHDVAGHHLSAVVVHASAAVRLGDPDLAREALRTAADTGREALRALERQAGEPPPGGDLPALLEALGDGLARLGVPVTLRVAGRVRRLPPEATAAMFRIVQEALTNAMRYGCAGEVRIGIDYRPGEVGARVTSPAASGGTAVPALGAGRGIAGMRERAAALGGTLEAGPVPPDGWRVTAVLPTARRRVPDRGHLLAAAPVVLCALPPAAAVAVPRAALLWWRRRAPVAVLVLLTVLDVPAAIAAGSTDAALLLYAAAFPVTMVAVYSAAAYGRGPLARPPGAIVAASPAGALLAAALQADPATAARGPAELAGLLLYGFAIGGAFAVPPLLACWAAGRVAAQRGAGWERDALETVAVRAGEAVLAERRRVAVAVRGGVLERTARLVGDAEAALAGPAAGAGAALERIRADARAALADVRTVLDALETAAEERR
ncbi:sensor histidine kinase [Actinomadura parmotrematis]|uniref:histidine kinase n=1 Tax=Actinomadura parmotrematis TaxID=2864039 RepID=A0ABS7FWF9_9ACTN|nr:histidine kinase [Actinomadura parmotrematis]MBW8483912.1 hypothetical protein [Actinomadura parmotrematis]